MTTGAAHRSSAGVPTTNGRPKAPPTKQAVAQQKVRDLIDRLNVGEMIPSERQLSVDFGFSRLTVRAALEGLVREGYLVRRHGSGTYVSRPKIAQQLTLTSFSEDMRRRGMVPGSRLVSIETVHAGARLGAALNVSPNEKVLQMQRLRLADGESMAIETLHVPAVLVPGLMRSDLENASFYELLRQRYGIIPSTGIQTIEPTVTSEDESRLLAVPLHSAAFLFERTTRSADDQTIEFVRSVYRGDRYRLVTELSPGHFEALAGTSSQPAAKRARRGGA